MPAMAQYVGTTAPLFPTLIVPLFPNSSVIPFSARPSTRSAPRPATPPPAAPVLATAPAQVAANATDLATHFAPADRTRMQATYVQTFATFKQFERKLGLTDNEVANGISAYIAGNYMILHGVDLPDPVFLKLVSQVRRGLQQNAGLQKVPAAQRRKLYEQTAMVGMFMAVAQLSRKTTAEDPAAIRNLQGSARANLALALGKSAETLRIDGQGMHF